MATVYIGLGSNLGASATLLAQALDALSRLGPVQSSGLYRTPPLGPQDQPDFFNAVACLHTTLAPEALLDQLQALEQQAGRVRRRHWGERTLDLDVLWYDGLMLDTPRLTVPHPGLMVRSFVLLPLLELAPALSVQGQLLSQLPAAQDPAVVRLAGPDWTDWGRLDEEKPDDHAE